MGGRGRHVSLRFGSIAKQRNGSQDGKCGLATGDLFLGVGPGEERGSLAWGDCLGNCLLLLHFVPSVNQPALSCDVVRCWLWQVKPPNQVVVIM